MPRSGSTAPRAWNRPALTGGAPPQPQRRGTRKESSAPARVLYSTDHVVQARPHPPGCAPRAGAGRGQTVRTAFPSGARPRWRVSVPGRRCGPFPPPAGEAGPGGAGEAARGPGGAAAASRCRGWEGRGLGEVGPARPAQPRCGVAARLSRVRRSRGPRLRRVRQPWGAETAGSVKRVLRAGCGRARSHRRSS